MKLSDWALFAAAVLLFPAQVPAQEAGPGDNSWLQWDYATGDWDRNRPLISESGVDLIATYTSQVWGNLSGGRKTGGAYIGVLEFGLDVDLEKAAAWRGGSFRTTWIWTHGSQPSLSLIGSNFAISGMEGPSSLRALDIWLQQKFCGDLLALRAGLFNADEEFTTSDNAALFQNAGFGWPLLLNGDYADNAPAYPYATPGIYLAVGRDEGWKFETSFMQGNAYSATANRHNFEWNFNRYDGFFLLNELQYRHTKWRLPGTYKVGAILDSGYVADSDGTGEVWGDVGAYAIADQMICREEGAGDELQGLSWFGRAGLAPPDRGSVNVYLDTGFVYAGPWPGRDDDAAGLGLAWAQMPPAATRQFDGGNAGLEMAFEATYKAQLTPWFSIQPDLQYIVQPGGSTALGNALVAGLSVSLAF